MRKLADIRVDHIAVSAVPGTHIDLCLREAAIVALEENQVVILDHNGNKFHASPSVLIGSVRTSGTRN